MIVVGNNICRVADKIDERCMNHPNKAAKIKLLINRTVFNNVS